MIGIIDDEKQLAPGVYVEENINSNFKVWSWMRNGLNLTSVNLMIFAYIFSNSNIGSTDILLSLKCMADWFGVSRQTLMRNIEKLPFVVKDNSNKGEDGYYHFNCYKIDMEALLTKFSNTSEDIYMEFLLSYKQLMLKRYPKDKEKINDYFKYLVKCKKGMDNEHQSDVQPIITIAEYLKLVALEGSTDVLSFDGAVDWAKDLLEEVKPVLSNIDTNTPQSMIDSSKSQILQSSTHVKTKGKKPESLGIVAKPTKPKLTKEQKQLERQRKLAEYTQTMYEMNMSFVTTNNIKDDSILEALNLYVETMMEESENNKGLTPVKYRTALNSLAKLISDEDKLIYINRAISGGYGQFIYDSATKIDKLNKVAKNKKHILEITEKFISNFPNAEESFAEEIRKYVDSCIIDDWTDYAFENRLNQLINANLTHEQVILVIRNTTGNGWKTWNFAAAGIDNTNKSIGVIPDVSQKEKEEEINKFISRHYLYLETNLKSELLRYIHDCEQGRMLTAQTLANNLEYLIHHKFLIPDMVNAVQDAIANNYKQFCQPDYEKEALIKKKYVTIEAYIRNCDSYRKQDCKREYKRNSQDSRLVDFAKTLENC